MEQSAGTLGIVRYLPLYEEGAKGTIRGSDERFALMRLPPESVEKYIEVERQDKLFACQVAPASIRSYHDPVEFSRLAGESEEKWLDGARAGAYLVLHYLRNPGISSRPEPPTDLVEREGWLSLKTRPDSWNHLWLRRTEEGLELEGSEAESGRRYHSLAITREYLLDLYLRYARVVEKEERQRRLDWLLKEAPLAAVTLLLEMKEEELPRLSEKEYSGLLMHPDPNVRLELISRFSRLVRRRVR